MRPLGKRQVSFDRPADRGEGAGVEASASGADSQRPASEMRTEAVPFPQFVAAPGQPTMTTWEDASGEPIFGEFDFMCDRLWIDDADVEEPIEFTRTEWVAVRRTKSWRSEDRPVCPSCHGEGETPSGAACGRCLGDGFFAEPIEEVVSDERWLVESGRDHAASAPLSELVAVVDRLERALGHSDPHMDGSSHVPYAKYLDRPGQEMLRVPSLMMADLRTMADALRVAVNIAGDIEAVADELASERHYECDDCWYSCPESGEGCCNDNYPRGSGCTCHAKRSHTLAARLRRIAAGIRGTLGEEDQ